MAEVYESASRASRAAASPNLHVATTPSAQDVIRMAESKASDGLEREESTQAGAAPSSPAPFHKQASLLPSNIPQQIKLNLTTVQLLQIKGDEIPPSTEPEFELALKKPGERLELIVNPVPDAQSLGSASVFHMLGKEGAKQPSILYGTVGYVVDYLIAPHVGMQKMNLVSYIPTQLRRPSMNVVARAETGRNVVKESIADWVLHLWDAFLLTYKDACTTEDLVKELVSRFEKSTERRPGASERPVSMSASAVAPFVQTSFETSNGHVVVARRALDAAGTLSPESLTSRTARSVLNWMGLVAENRSGSAIKTNTLLFTLHWLRSSTGPLDLAADRPAFEALYKCMDDATALEDIEMVSLARLVLKDLKVIRDTCGFDRIKVERAFGLDFEGLISRQSADADQYRIREMLLCYAARPLPAWVFKAEPIHKRNPSQVAAELTLLMYDLCYRHVHPLMLVSEKSRHNSRPVQDMIRLFRVLSYWPLTCIFAEGIKPQARLQRLVFFISLAEHLRKMCNFHALFAVMAALTQPYGLWLWKSFNSSDSTKVSKRFEDLKRAISNYGDYRVYKADLSHAHGKSRIPFLGITTRHLAALESDHSHSVNHPQLYHFARQVARSAAINEFLGGQRHPYASTTGYTYAVSAGPPGASAFHLHPEGAVVGSRFAQNPPMTVWNGTYSQNKLSVGEIDFHVGVPPQVITPPAFWGSTELPHDEDLRLLLAWDLSCTLTEDAVKELAMDAKAGQDELVVSSLEAAGFM